MRVIHISSVFLPYASGTSNVVYEQAQELVKRGHEVTVITPGDGEEEMGGIRIIRVKPLWRVGLGTFVPGIIKQLREHSDSDTVLHIHTPWLGNIEVLWLVKLFRLISYKKLIIQYHHDTQLKFPLIIIDFLSNIFLKSLIKSADQVLVSSLDYIENSKLKKIINNKFIELPLGVDENRFKSKVDSYKLEEDQGLVKILFVGALDKAHHFKGLEVLLDAVSKLRVTDYQLQIIGKGDLLNNYKKTAEQLGLNDKVEFLGFIPDEELPKYHQLADVFVFPSTGKAEAFGLVALEAMSAGLPVIASDLPGVRTLFADQKLIVKPGSVTDLVAKLELLLGDKELRLAIGQRNRARVLEKYTWSKIINKLEEIYNS